jgi:hypothetical protein
MSFARVSGAVGHRLCLSAGCARVGTERHRLASQNILITDNISLATYEILS